MQRGGAPGEHPPPRSPVCSHCTPGASRSGSPRLMSFRRAPRHSTDSVLYHSSASSSARHHGSPWATLATPGCPTQHPQPGLPGRCPVPESQVKVRAESSVKMMATACLLVSLGSRVMHLTLLISVTCTGVEGSPRAAPRPCHPLYRDSDTCSTQTLSPAAAPRS